MTAERAHRRLCILFVLVSSSVFFIARAEPAMRGPYGVALRIVLAALMLAAWAASRRVPRRAHVWTLAAGLAARLVVAPAAVSSSHDVQRYLWDGRVLLAGVDPYRVPPISPDVAGLRAAWPTPVEHERYPTLYPPGALSLFAVAASFGIFWAPWVWKGFIVAASLSTLWIGWRVLEQRDLVGHLPLLAFSPLLLMETATGAHLDVFCALAVMAALRFGHQQRFGAAGMTLGAGVLIKLLPGVALLPIVAAGSWPQARRLFGGAAAVVGAGYLAAFVSGLQPLGSLPVFLERWRFGSPVFEVLAALVGNRSARYTAALLAAAALALIAARARRHGWSAALPLALGAPLLFSPVVFPWYLSSLAASVVAAPSGFVVAWLTAAPLASEAVDRFEAGSAWEPALWPLIAIAAAWVIGSTADVMGARRRRAVDRIVRSVKALTANGAASGDPGGMTLGSGGERTVSP